MVFLVLDIIHHILVHYNLQHNPNHMLRKYHYLKDTFQVHSLRQIEPNIQCRTRIRLKLVAFPIRLKLVTLPMVFYLV
jgi:hypothetical protein